MANVAKAYGWWIAKDCCTLAILKVSYVRLMSNSLVRLGFRVLILCFSAHWFRAPQTPHNKLSNRPLHTPIHRNTSVGTSTRHLHTHDAQSRKAGRSVHKSNADRSVDSWLALFSTEGDVSAYWRKRWTVGEVGDWGCNGYVEDWHGHCS
jgi:hypothetical protein